MSSFEIRDQFYLDGKPFKVISGAFHYFRTVPEYWEDRLLKLKALGCNTVETYIPWNLHEPKPGVYDFKGILDVEHFIELAAKLGLYMIVRPSPYICAEWEFGGLPGWLLAGDDMKLRISEGPFLKTFENYYNVLIPKLVPHQIDRGGNIILMQVENEYGYYANDRKYMDTLRDIIKGLGVTVPLITSDNPELENLRGGSIEGALPTGNFGSRTDERFSILKEHIGDKPLMCAEFWVGWFDHWGNGGHMRGNLEESVKDLDRMLELGNVNIYMFQGGTNFGFMNGSNYYDKLTPDVTSYDYDGILTEDGRITEKYRRYREVIGKYAPTPDIEFKKIDRRAYGELSCKDKVGLFETLEDISKPVHKTAPCSMERLGQSYGYILYRSVLNTEEKIGKFRLWEAGDRANVFVDGEPVVTLYDTELLEERKLGVKGTLNKRLDILMENMGRVNFGPRMEHQRKGIDQCVQINGHMHNNWDIYTLPLTNIDKIDYTKGWTEGAPAFYRFEFTAEEAADTFLDFEGWGKGCAFINGFNLGRYWEIGPQKRLYIPGPLIKQGLNEIVMFETDGKAPGTITLKDEPDIG
ncbi:MAG: beta-galactosidase [Lachnospiraceae bacterium]|nr:beta-galactosidase [Lachnospiraceae bacterium]